MQSAFRLPRVYPLTDTHLSGLSHAEQVRLLSRGGATLVQLREKQMSPKEFYEQAKAAVTVAEQCGVRLIINDRVDIALAVGAHGIHLGQDDMPPEAARKLMGEQAVVGYSTHDVKQAIEASKLPIDYLAIGPIFTTSTKSDTAPCSVSRVAAVRQAIGDFPSWLSAASLMPTPDVIDAGADSVAVISASVSTQIASLKQLKPSSCLSELTR
jgi:thiamine-phosphate pyrophosphorylase